MAKVLVLYYSAYGHIEAMANAVAAGAREAGATVDIKRVPELVPADVAKASYYKLDQSAPVVLTVRGATLQILATCPVVKIVFMAGSPMTYQCRGMRALWRLLLPRWPAIRALWSSWRARVVWGRSKSRVLKDGCWFFASAVCRHTLAGIVREND